MEPITIKFPGSTQLTDDQLFEFCVKNKGLRIERDANGQLIVMSPVGGTGSSINLTVASLLWHWNSQHRLGIAFDSSVGFRLANNAMRSPDAAWISIDRWSSLSTDEKEKFPPLAPDFVIEIRSKSDSLAELKKKMEEWMSNGTKLSWLIDPIDQKVYVSRPGQLNAEVIESFTNTTIRADEIVAGFCIDLSLLL